MIRGSRHLGLSGALMVLTLLCTASGVRAASTTVFAAASLRTVMDVAVKSYADQTGEAVTPSYAASSTLAKQIEQGAPADVFASADLAWMDYLAERGAIEPSTRVNLLGNALVLIAPKNSALDRVALDRASLDKALGPDGKLVTGDPRAVPVGKYARHALDSLQLWSGLEPRIASADNVRSALAFVARGEAPLGIVYATDAAVEPNVKVVATFPVGSYPPIVYPFALTKSAGPEAGKFLAFLQGPTMSAVFVRAGFTVLAPQRTQ